MAWVKVLVTLVLTRPVPGISRKDLEKPEFCSSGCSLSDWNYFRKHPSSWQDQTRTVNPRWNSQFHRDHRELHHMGADLGNRGTTPPKADPFVDGQILS